MSTMAPMRKPTRMPFFTHAFVRQPGECDASGSAERMRPELSSPLNERKSARSSSEYRVGFASNRASICFSSSSAAVGNVGPFEKSEGFQHGANLREIFRSRRHKRQTENGFEQPHFRHGRFHGPWVRFDEVHFEQRQPLALHQARLREIPRQTQLREARHLRGNFV